MDEIATDDGWMRINLVMIWPKLTPSVDENKKTEGKYPTKDATGVAKGSEDDDKL